MPIHMSQVVDSFQRLADCSNWTQGGYVPSLSQALFLSQQGVEGGLGGAILFNLFASIALISATMVILSKNPIHSVIFPILVFCNATGLLISLKIESLAMMFIIIYVGAIAVLFLFVVMMLNIKVHELNENSLRYLPIGGIIVPTISLIPLTELALILDSDFSSGTILNWTDALQHGNAICWNLGFGEPKSLLYENFYPSQRPWSSLIDGVTNIQSLGYLIYTYYFYYFPMASSILLVAMIGAIVLTLYKRRRSKASKKQFIFQQVARNFGDSIGYAREALPGDPAPHAKNASAPQCLRP